jgi:predicted glycoside hydrolase/deacetylase ChbG (UPF0249 family)
VAGVKHLIVNADDFGLCAQVNAGITAAHDHGIVTSTSLMVRHPGAAEAARLAASRPSLAVGLHVDLGEWEPDRDGYGWSQRWAVLDTDDVDAVAREIDRQIERFVELTGHPPTHLDGHQHVQRDGPAAHVLRARAADLGVSLRLHNPRVSYRGDFYGQAHRGVPYPQGITTANLIAVISSLADGWAEMACHPGIGVPSSVTSYAIERDVELAVLCNVEVRAALAAHDVTLASFAELGSG